MKPVQRALLRWYRAHGRRHLPWRKTRDPYRILVSEFMLQQTQVDRVLPKYSAFVERFPDFASLASAALADVLVAWKGLGYNSRAVRLHRIAREAIEKYGGLLPSDTNILRNLGGIGEYTAAALRAFAFELDDCAVDTNVLRVVHRLQFGVEFPPRASRRALAAAARDLVPRGGAHDWNSAMMDLGSSLCTARAPKCLLCPLREHCAAAPIDAGQLEASRARHAPPKSPQQRVKFEESTRYVRGRIIDRLRELPAGERISLLDLRAQLPQTVRIDQRQFGAIVQALHRDGLIEVGSEQVGLAK